MSHYENCNFIGNLNRIKEMTDAGLLPEEQSAVFFANGIPASPSTIDAAIEVINNRDALASKALYSTATTTAINNHAQITAEYEDNEEGGTELYVIDGVLYIEIDGQASKYADYVE
jgi:hypothetical protein